MKKFSFGENFERASYCDLRQANLWIVPCFLAFAPHTLGN